MLEAFLLQRIVKLYFLMNAAGMSLEGLRKRKYLTK